MCLYGERGVRRMDNIVIFAIWLAGVLGAILGNREE